MEGDIYHDPFDRCTELIAIAQTFNMTVKEYLLHLNKLKEDRIKFRVWVLICLKRINDKRISDSEEGEAKMRKLNVGGSSRDSSNNSGRRSGGGSSDDITNQAQQRLLLNGVLAESKITAFEMWREIAMFL